MESSYVKFLFQIIIVWVILVPNKAFKLVSKQHGYELNAVCHRISSSIFPNIKLTEGFEFKYSCDEEKSTTGKFLCSPISKEITVLESKRDPYCCTGCGDGVQPGSAENQDHICNECYFVDKSGTTFEYEGRQITNNAQRQELKKMWKARREKWEKVNKKQSQEVSQKYKSGGISSKTTNQIIIQVLVVCFVLSYMFLQV